LKGSLRRERFLERSRKGGNKMRSDRRRSRRVSFRRCCSRRDLALTRTRRLRKRMAAMLIRLYLPEWALEWKTEGRTKLIVFGLLLRDWAKRLRTESGKFSLTTK